MRYLQLFCLAAALFAGGNAVARERNSADSSQPEVFRQLVNCRQMTDPAARLACYDARVAALDTAARNRDIVMADRNEVREARRGLFGFAAPVGRLFGFGGDNDEDEADVIRRIDTKVASVSRNREGGWRLALAEGGTWEQVDMRNFVMSPRAGQSAAVTKGAVGSHFVSVNGQPGIKMRRVE